MPNECGRRGSNLYSFVNDITETGWFVGESHTIEHTIESKTKSLESSCFGYQMALTFKRTSSDDSDDSDSSEHYPNDIESKHSNQILLI